MLELQADTGKGLIVTLFVAVALLLFIFTTSLTAALLGAAIAAVALTLVYYLGVRVDAKARGGY